MKNEITELFGIEYPIIQGGMVWCSGWRLVSAVSNAGGLGLLGAGSMYPEVLREHIQKTKKATRKPFGVNIPLLYPNVENLMDILVEEGVKIVFTSAGNPSIWTEWLKNRGITVVHVVSSSKFALKAEKAGVDAVVAEGFEAGGHNGREETTTLCLIPQVVESVKIPVIAAGGISTGKSMLATFALGAKGVQIGSRFAACLESSAHQNFKEQVVKATEGDTILTLKNLTPVRLIRNSFYKEVEQAESQCASREKLIELLGKRRAKLGIFEGNIEDGELEIGQVSSLITTIEPAADVVGSVWEEFVKEIENLQKLDLK